jgi:hypothetical protein
VLEAKAGHIEWSAGKSLPVRGARHASDTACAVRRRIRHCVEKWLHAAKLARIVRGLRHTAVFRSIHFSMKTHSFNTLRSAALPTGRDVDARAFARPGNGLRDAAEGKRYT